MAISYDDAVSIAVKALVNAGVPNDSAKIQADLLIEADLRGKPSHGLMRLPRILKRIQNNVINPESIGMHNWRLTSYLEVDGQKGLGPVVAINALDKAVIRAQQTGVVLVSIKNNNHLGMLGWYAARYTKQGSILIGISNSEALVHPWGGQFPMLGTNPLTVGVPTDAEPFILDMATSLVSMGKIHDYAQKNKPLKTGWALDGYGNPTTDANLAKKGSIAPFGGAKGYALGLAIEVLVASIVDSAVATDVKGTLDTTEVCNKGDIFILINLSRNHSVAKVGAYLDAVRSSGTAQDVPVIVPGDRANANRKHALQAGLNLPPQLWAEICDAAGITKTI